jgi:hypothetical protein
LNGATTGVAVANDNTFGFIQQWMYVVLLPPAGRSMLWPIRRFWQSYEAIGAGKVTLRKETPLIQIIDRPYFTIEEGKIWEG